MDINGVVQTYVDCSCLLLLDVGETLGILNVEESTYDAHWSGLYRHD